MKRISSLREIIFGLVFMGLLVLSIFATPWLARAQENQPPTSERDTLMAAALEIMEASRYCALITLDPTGRPHARTMDPFPPENDMIIWFGTSSKSRKVKEIRHDPRVSLYYADPGGGGYVVIAGTAFLVDEAKEKQKRWKDEWEEFYSDQKDNYILIKVIPENLEILSYKHGILGDAVTWRTPSIDFKTKESKN
ncbi:MAG: pyridoxamine 5'-phosphate oxidase family protein [bacterium]